MTGRRADVRGVALTVLFVGTMLVLLMLAARTGPHPITRGTVIDPHFGLDPQAQPPRLRPHHLNHRGDGVFGSPAVLTWTGRFLKIVVLALWAWLAYRAVRLVVEALRGRERPAPRPADVQFDVLDDPGELVDVMREDAASQRALLTGGSPRNAIVACWDRFEEQAARVGLARRPWETSSEFTLRLLDFVAADGGAVARLELLYHEARFSEHVIDEDRRLAAAEALEAIHASLPARARAGR